jgi:hypothetical protein
VFGMIDYTIADDVLWVEIPGVRDTLSASVGYQCGEILFSLARNGITVNSDFMWIDQASEEGAFLAI